MDSFHFLKKQLIEKINAYQPQREEITVLQSQSAVEVNLLSWLKAQNAYPQFYLKRRDEAQTFAALGKVRSFSDTNLAQQFIEAHDLTLIGGLTFDGETLLYLPRLLLLQEKDQLTVHLFIDNRVDWATEKAQLLPLLETFAKTTALLPIQQSIYQHSPTASQAQWCQWVENTLQHIQQGHAGKIVLANETLFHTKQPLCAKEVLAESEQYNVGCYHFLLARDAECSFIGSTPERLYQRDGDQLQTEALAGTAFMSEDEQLNRQQATWLLHDPKNIYENSLVVEDIQQNLRPFSTQIEVSELGIKQLRQVQHLRRQISAKLAENCGDSVCLQAIHPTAAVAGLPRQAAKQFLQQTETFQRSWYAGTLGFMRQQQAEFCVTIRSAFIEQNKIRVFAGAGIVEGSIPLLEWQEIERKALGLISLLQE
ncbi:isochorismate synthase [[Pasteurella] aerogenes]|nr:isochorismate synthase [[Pasteurella] aerogenes]